MASARSSGRSRRSLHPPQLPHIRACRARRGPGTTGRHAGERWRAPRAQLRGRLAILDHRAEQRCLPVGGRREGPAAQLRRQDPCDPPRTPYGEHRQPPRAERPVPRLHPPGAQERSRAGPVGQRVPLGPEARRASRGPRLTRAPASAVRARAARAGCPRRADRDRPRGQHRSVSPGRLWARPSIAQSSRSSPRGDPRWDAFVESHPDGSAYHPAPGPRSCAPATGSDPPISRLNPGSRELLGSYR